MKIIHFCEECGAIAELICKEHPYAKLMKAEIIDSNDEEPIKEEPSNILN